MIFARRRAGSVPGPVPVRERWRQVFEVGEAVLHQFSPAELDAVTLEPASVRPEGGLPYLQRLSPLLGLAPLPAEDLGAGDLGAADVGAADVEAKAAYLSELANAVAGLEDSGFVRSAPPAPPVREMPIEFAGVAAAADGEPPRPVALASDLGLITYMRCRPLFVVEVYHATNPAAPDGQGAGWQLVARGYVPYQMPGCLFERPSAPRARTAQRGQKVEQPPLIIVREDRAAGAWLQWLGGNVPAYLRLREARAARQAGEPAQAGEPGQAGETARTDRPALDVPTATVAAGFSLLAKLSLAVPAGTEVVLRALAVGTSAAGHWLLSGEQLERATPVTLEQLGDRIDEMLTTASRPGAAAPPDGPEAALSDVLDAPPSDEPEDLSLGWPEDLSLGWPDAAPPDRPDAGSLGWPDAL